MHMKKLPKARERLKWAKFNISPSIIGRTSRQQICKVTKDLHNTLNQLDLNNIYRTLHPMTAEYTFFSSVLETFTNTDCILAQKANYQPIKVSTSCKVCFLNGAKLEIINQNIWNSRHFCKLNNIFLNIQWVKNNYWDLPGGVVA